MPHAGMPFLRRNSLLLPDGRVIEVDSPAWRAWLAEATHFAYQPPDSTFRLTLRKEKRRHGWYWYAYLRRDGKLHNAYVGRSEVVTAARLWRTGAMLLARSVRSAAGDAT